LRYFNAAGSDPEGEIGEDHDPETHLVPLVLDAAIGARPNVTILGNDYDTPDGTCVRDYIHVSDIAAAHVLALQLLEKGKLRQAYNLGTGVGVSVLQVIEAVRRVTSRNVPVVVGPRRAGDPAILLAEAVRAHEDLGWRPQFSSIDQMIETAWSWRIARQALHHDPVILSNSRK
jgi:UDP-glucose 4-epimerase